MSVKIYHNPRCGKSRTACLVLSNKLEFEVIKYLETGLTKAAIEEILVKGNFKIEEIVRTTENVYKINFKTKKLNQNQWIDALIENPILLQRPIVVTSLKAYILRDDNAINEFLQNAN